MVQLGILVAAAVAAAAAAEQIIRRNRGICLTMKKAITNFFDQNQKRSKFRIEMVKTIPLYCHFKRMMNNYF